MRIELTARQEKHRAGFRAFAAERIAPLAGAFDREQAIPRGLIADLAGGGYLASHVPRDQGGRGLDMIAYGLLHEEFGQACSSVRTLLTVHDMVAEVILRIGGARLRRGSWLPRPEPERRVGIPGSS